MGCQWESTSRLLYSPSLVHIGLSVVYETWPPIGWHHLFIPPASTKLKGGSTGFTLSVPLPVCPSVDRIVSALYLQQYSSDPFHICTSLIQIWPSCCFFVPSAARVRFQNHLKSRGGCATKMLRTEIIELLNASSKSTHVLCIDRKLRSFWVEWRSYHICRCSRTYMLNNLIHQLHNMFLLRLTFRCTGSLSNHWSGIQVARACCQDARATAAGMSLKAGTAD